MSVQRLAEILCTKNILLLLDNCEHVARRGGGHRRQSYGRLQSRADPGHKPEPLHVAAEHVYRLSTLKTPSRTIGLSAEEASKYPAVELFVERAAASADRFTLDDANAPVVAAICGQFGRSRARDRDCGDTHGRVRCRRHRGHAGRPLPRASANAPRHAGAPYIAFGHAGLELRHARMDQRAFLHRISSFSSRFTVEDAVAVAGDDVFSRATVIECLADLVDKSFVTVDLAGTARFIAYTKRCASTPGRNP